MDSSSTTDNSLLASLEAMDVKTLFKHLDLVTKTLKQKVKDVSKGRRRKNKSSDSADGDASSTSSKKEQPKAVAEWNAQCKDITALYKASLPEGTKLKPGFHLRLAGAVKHLAGDKAISVTAETVAAAVAFLEQNPDWSTKTKASRAAKKNSSSDTETKASSKPSKPADPESDADSDSDAEPEVKPKKVKKDKADKPSKPKADKPKKAKKPAKKADSDDESSDSDSEPEVKPKKASKKAAKADKPSKADKKAAKKPAKPVEPESDADSDSDDDGPAAERIKIDGVNYWVNPSSNDVYEDVDGSLGDKIGKLNEDGDGIVHSA